MRTRPNKPNHMHWRAGFWLGWLGDPAPSRVPFARYVGWLDGNNKRDALTGYGAVHWVAAIAEKQNSREY